MELTVEQDPGKEAETLRSNSSNSSSADVFEEILSASKLASALGRIRRETRSQVSQSEGQTSEAVLTHKDSIPVLTRQLSNRITNDLQLFKLLREILKPQPHLIPLHLHLFPTLSELAKL